MREKATEYARIVRRSGGTKAAVLLDELSANIDLVSPEDLGKAAINLLGVASAFTNPTDEFRDGLPAIWNFWFVTKSILERLDPSSREDALKSAFANAESLRGLNFALNVFRASLGRDPDAKPESAGPPLVDTAVCEELEHILCTRFRGSASDGTLILERGLVRNLLLWGYLGGEAEVKAFTQTVLNDDVLVLALAKAVTQMGLSLATGDRSSRERPVVDRSVLEKIVDANQLIARLDAMSGGDRDPNERHVIDNFKLELRNQSPFNLHPDGATR